uniref:Uncharacterized protein n=1 Tax=Opuntia streptacantha TaxID=393608 RepID=A0A7C9F741_OPUST
MEVNSSTIRQGQSFGFSVSVQTWHMPPRWQHCPLVAGFQHSGLYGKEKGRLLFPCIRHGCQILKGTKGQIPPFLPKLPSGWQSALLAPSHLHCPYLLVQHQVQLWLPSLQT